MVRWKLPLKIGAIAVLSLLLLVPLWMIESQIAQRGAHQDEVVRNIAESAAGSQTLLGPVLVLRYREHVPVSAHDAATGRDLVRQDVVEGTVILPPQELKISGEAHLESRRRGLYRARVFHLASHVAASVRAPANAGLDDSHKVFEVNAELVLGVTDPRGIDIDPAVDVNGETLHFEAGAPGLGSPSAPVHGVHLELGPVDPSRGRSFDIEFPLTLTGTERLRIAPAGEATTVTLRSDWRHPSFQGRFTPTSRTVDAAGFEATWQVSHLARSFDSVLKAMDPGAAGDALEVAFIEPVNVYVMSDRAVRYGILFVVLTFGAFFLTEVLSGRPIHPMQYLLVGLALAIFFLLLIALSEHVRFAVAYVSSALACVALVGVYLGGALGGRRQAAGFAGALGLLYAVLYAVLLSEDNAFLMGAGLMFAALAATMLATRRIDWYRIGV